MLSIENHCVGCTSLGLHCIGRHCRNRNVEVHYCDSCGSELTKIYEADDKELCADCYDEQYGEDDD